MMMMMMMVVVVLVLVVLNAQETGPSQQPFNSVVFMSKQSREVEIQVLLSFVFI
jgi:hypothetical protein